MLPLLLVIPSTIVLATAAAVAFAGITMAFAGVTPDITIVVDTAIFFLFLALLLALTLSSLLFLLVLPLVLAMPSLQLFLLSPCLFC